MNGDIVIYKQDGSNIISILTSPSAARLVLNVPPALTPKTATGTGTGYTLTTTLTTLSCSNGIPSVTLNVPGTWKLEGYTTVNYVSANISLSRTITLGYYRINNTPGALNNTVTVNTGAVSAVNGLQTAYSGALPPLIYTTSNITDQIGVCANISSLPLAGSVRADTLYILATRVSDV